MTTIPTDQVLGDPKEKCVSRTYRAGTKKARLVELLRQPKGMSIERLSAELDWKPHSTRAALTGLRNDGHTVTKLALQDGERASRYRLKA